MKLLYCIPALFNSGGMERVLTEKVNYLAKSPEFEIYIVTTDHKKDQPILFSLDSSITVIHLDIDFVAHYDRNLFIKYLLHKKKLKTYKKNLIKIINNYKIDICISLCGKEIDFLSHLNVNCKKIAEIHFSMNNRKQFIDSRHNGFLWRFIGKFRTYQLQQSVKDLDKFIVLTKEDKKQWQKYCSNVNQIYNPAFINNNSIPRLENKKIISVGRLDPQKGYDMLLKAWKLVVVRHPDWKLEIYGDGYLKETLKKMILNYDISDNTCLCGVTSDIKSKYLESSIYVATSRYEGFPLSILEAISCGLPIVSFDCEFGPRELIDDGENGFLIEPNNIYLLADKICYLIENEEIRKTMGINAHNKSQQFSIDKIMLQWAILLKGIINSDQY